ncbi:MAG: hypothetical protein WBX03_13345 [Terriglobales bacterium]|jgi:hypothetical protein
MKDTKSTFLHRVVASGPSLALIIIILTAAATTTAAQTNVFVPGNATGCFGSTDTGCAPLVAALTVTGPGTITVTYVSGTVDWGSAEVGPNGGPYPNTSDYQFPLEEAEGIAPHTKINNIAALIGVFVPQARAQYKGFNPVDGTKNLTTVGILPNGLFFVGTGKTASVNGPGTLFLGINDTMASDNSGGFNVTVEVE